MQEGKFHPHDKVILSDFGVENLYGKSNAVDMPKKTGEVLALGVDARYVKILIEGRKTPEFFPESYWDKITL